LLIAAKQNTTESGDSVKTQRGKLPSYLAPQIFRLKTSAFTGFSLRAASANSTSAFDAGFDDTRHDAVGKAIGRNVLLLIDGA
jgi:hypothetical protein